MINIAPVDLALSVTQALPASGANVTTGIIDLQCVAPNSDAFQYGVFAVTFPALPENTGTGITVAMQCAGPSLTNSPAAPSLPVPGAFAAPADAQTITNLGVAVIGTGPAVFYFNPTFDVNGSCFQFYQFVITTPVGTNTVGEPVTIAWQSRW